MTEEAGSFFPDETKLETKTPKSGLLLDAQGEAEASEDTGNQPQGVG